MTSGNSRNATSSPASAPGPSLPGLLDGPTNANCGPDRARASRSARRASAPEQMIQGICGRTFIASSVPDGPLSSWENKLRERLGGIGSTEFALIWKATHTPRGLSISRLAPSTRHTNGTACTGSLWPTPKASSAGESSRSGDRKDEPLMGGLMRLAQWSTPRASDGEKGAPRQNFSAGGAAASGADIRERGGMGDAVGARLEGHAGHGDSCGGRTRSAGSASPANGRNGSWWADADWIECHDGKARRAKSSIPMLVNGLAGRIGLWRLAGNSISPILAAEVIAAFLDVYGAAVSDAFEQIGQHS